MRLKSATTLAAATAIVLLTTGCATAGNTAAQTAAAERGQAKLAKLIEGREAGEPVRCVSTFANQSLTVIDRTAMYVKQGNTIYVNTTTRPESLDDDDVLLIEKRGTNDLCSNQPIKFLDRGSGFFKGFVTLSEFVPYKKVS